MEMKKLTLRLGAVTFAALLTGAVFAQSEQKSDLRERVRNAKQEYKDGHLVESLEHFERLAKEAPDSIDIEAWLGFLYLQNHRPQDAIQPLEKAAAAKPNDLEINSNLGSRTWMPVKAIKP